MKSDIKNEEINQDKLVVDTSNKSRKTKRTKGQMSKFMLKLDYIISAILLLFFFICVGVNVGYYVYMALQLVKTGAFDYLSSISAPIDLSNIAIIMTGWFAQLGISSGAYYFMAKSDHCKEIPAQMIKDLPQEMQDRVDPTQVLTAVITTKN